MTQTDILFFHNFWIFHLWDHFLAKKLGEGGAGGMDQGCVPYPILDMSFSIFEVFILPSKFLCPSKALETSKVCYSEGMTAKQNILKSIFAQNIASNDIFRLLESQPTQSVSFSIFEIFVLLVKILMSQ